MLLLLAISCLFGGLSAQDFQMETHPAGVFEIQPRNDEIVLEPRDGSDFKLQIQPRSTYQEFNVGEDYTLTFNSPNYPSPYGEYNDLGLTFNSRPNTFIRMHCSEFNVEYSRNCEKDAFTVFPHGSITMSRAEVWCGRGTITSQSTTNRLTFRFASKNRWDNSQSFRFRCTVQAFPDPNAVAPTTTAAPTTARTTVMTTAKTATAPRPASDCTCGRRNKATRIVNGTDAELNEFPWRCGLYVENQGVICGSSIISNEWVLTAAHCCHELNITQVHTNCGDHDMRTSSESHNVLTKVDRMINHPNYDSKTQDNDMCLLHLAKPLEFNREISPVCLPFHGEGNRCETPTDIVASGWGADASGGKPQFTLQKVDLPCMSAQACREYYPPSMVTDNMICTYKKNQDTCQGDSGGSIDHEAADGNYYCLGVVSWGVGCAYERRPGVYATTQNYLNWIKETTGDTFCGEEGSPFLNQNFVAG